MGPESNDRYRCKRQKSKRHSETQGSGCVKTEAEIGVMQSQAKNWQEPPEAEAASMGPLAPWIPTSGLQNCVRTNLCCFTPPNFGKLLWQP